MTQEKTKKPARSIALSGFIGFVLVALLVGMMIGGYLALFVIAPNIQAMQQNNGNQENTGNQNGNYQGGSNNQTPTSTPSNNQNYNGYQGNTGDQSGNTQNESKYKEKTNQQQK